MRQQLLLMVAALISLGQGTCQAQSFVEHVSPPVVRRGAVNRVTLNGTESNQVVGLWTSLPAGMVQARVVSDGLTQSVLDLEMSADAPLGIYGLRLATRSGLSNVHLFVVDELPVLIRDPALPPTAVVPLTLPTCATSLCKPASIDRYAITVDRDQRVAFEVVGNRLGKDYDPLIQIRNSTGKLVAEHDHSVGLLFDCRFAHRFTEAGTYTVEVRDARFEGRSTWHYVLRMGDFPEARTAIPSSVRAGETAILSFPQMAGWQYPVTVPNAAPLGELFQEIRQSPPGVAAWIPLTVTDLNASLEMEPNDSQETATPTVVPGTLNGVFDKPGDRDWYSFDLIKDQKLNFLGVARTIGSAADLELILFDADGREVRRVDDTDLEEGGFTFNVGKPGVHRLQVREVSRDGGPEFAYRIDVRGGGPQFQLLAEASDLTVPQGNSQSLPIKVTRTEFTGEIQLELRGVPAGISIVPAIIPANTVEFAGRVVADAATPAGIYNLQVVGTAALETGSKLHAVAGTKPLIDRQLKNVDLIPYALREDQRHLPPSLLQQIALMVVPPAPFDVELPEAILPLIRFQSADFPITTTRKAGFDAPITFAVKGGQIGDEKEERNQVYARLVPGTVDRLTASGTFFNRINTQLNKYRVDLTASAEVEGRRINLVRAFTLDVRSAFRPTYEPETPAARPGESVNVKLVANRVPTFDGALKFTLGPQSGLVFPATIEIPAGQPSVDVDIKIDPKLNPGRHGIRVEVAGFVGKYEESLNLPNLQIEVHKPDAPK
ncbi:MAG: hypothetical protein JSS49_15835 [Planctomycetes bacterium]|nr:hypothetical protein [Planctomycetota bacterium]